MITEQPDHLGEVGRLMGLLVEGALKPVDCRRLEELLLADSAALEYYQDYIDLHCLLHWHHGQTDDEGEQREGGEEDSEFLGQEPGASVHPSSFLPYPSSIPPIIIDPSPTLHSPLFTLHSPVGSFVFSHLAAAVILGVGLLAGLAWRISLPSEKGGIVGIDRRQESPPTIGRITALADCRWKQWRVESGEWRANPEIPKSPNPPIPVSPGDRFALSSGFMEITYDTGAKVLLEGPCIYEVESARSGFLAIGKLTALVEKGEGRRVKGEKGAGSRLSALDSGLFAVRTPTAVVTDLGTEFGVEVERSGATRSHVFQGRIELRAQEDSRGLTARGEPPVDHVVQLTAGESARVERGRNRVVAIVRESGQAERFVRRMPGGLAESRESRVQSPEPTQAIERLSPLAPRPLPLSYRLTDLGTLGGKTSYATSINAAGQVVGAARNATGTQHAFLYSDGTMKDIGVPGVAYDINGLGQIVGQYDTDRVHNRAFLYSDGATKSLGSLSSHRSCAHAINDFGQIVGYSARSNDVDQAFRYTITEGMQALGALGGPKAKSRAMGINVRGQVAGYSETKNGRMHAFLYSDADGMVDLGTLSGNISWACSINNAGVIAGFSTAKGAQLHIVCGHNAEMQDFGYLCTLSSKNNLTIDINNVGQVIGNVQTTTRGVATTQAFLYSCGKMLDINRLVAPTHGWKNLYASAINDSGQIVGHGVAPDGSTRAFMLTPFKRQRNGIDGKGRSKSQAPTPKPEDL